MGTEIQKKKKGKEKWVKKQKRKNERKKNKSKKRKTSLTEYRHKMRSGDPPAYLFLNGPSNGSFMLWMFNFSLNVLQVALHHVPSAILFHFSQNIRNSTRVWWTDRRTDGPTDGRTDERTDGPTDRRTDIPSYRDARSHLKISAGATVWSKGDGGPGEKAKEWEREHPSARGETKAL